MKLSDKLHDAGIKYRHLNRGDQRLVCPECEGGRTKEKSLNLTITGDGAVWCCHRATCGNKGGYSDNFGKGNFVGRRTGHRASSVEQDARDLRRRHVWA